jgi:hypothetical protein
VLRACDVRGETLLMDLSCSLSAAILARLFIILLTLSGGGFLVFEGCSLAANGGSAAAIQLQQCPCITSHIQHLAFSLNILGVDMRRQADACLLCVLSGFKVVVFAGSWAKLRL